MEISFASIILSFKNYIISILFEISMKKSFREFFKFLSHNQIAAFFFFLTLLQLQKRNQDPDKSSYIRHITLWTFRAKSISLSSFLLLSPFDPYLMSAYLPLDFFRSGNIGRNTTFTVHSQKNVINIIFLV